jgi:hypothetical protein
VLIGQQRRRHQDRDLLAVLHGLERRPHRDLGLAVADVTADHPVHGHRLLHVGLDVVDGSQLIHGLGESERVLHLGLPRGVRPERVTRCGLPLGVERHQLAGDLADRAARLGLGVGPVAAAEPAQRRLGAADVAGQLIQRVHRHVELVGPSAASRRGVLEHQVPRRAPPTMRSVISTNRPMPCSVVHHQVARRQRQRVDDVAALGGQPLALRRRRGCRSGRSR